MSDSELLQRIRQILAECVDSQYDGDETVNRLLDLPGMSDSPREASD